MGKWKRILSAAMAGIMCMSFAACGKDAADKGKVSRSQNQGETAAQQESNGDGSEGGSKGRLVESILEAPKGEMLNIRALEDGTLRAITTTGIYDSADQGESWKPWGSQPKELADGFESSFSREKEYTGLTVGATAIGRDGTVFYAAIQDKAQYKVIRPDGTEQVFDLALPEPEESGTDLALMGGGTGARIDSAEFSDNGELLCSDNRSIYQIDADSLTLKHTYEIMQPDADDMGGGFELCVSGDNLYAIIQEYVFPASDKEESSGEVIMPEVEVEVKSYKLDSFEEEQNLEVLSEFFMSKDGGAGDIGYMMLSGAGDNSLYIVNTNGIYRYQTGGTMVEKIFNGALGQMSNPVSLLAMGTVLDKDHIYLGDFNQKVYRYLYDPEVPSEPEESLSVYALYDNRTVRQAISAFQTQNPNVLVELEVGITGEDAITRTDALKTLNTSIMAGEGPDILLLDGMPIESYMEKGLLQDMSDVVEKVNKTDGIFENILSCYEKDGKNLAVPTRFAVPVIMGDEELLKQAENLTKLADAIEKIRQDNPNAKTIMGNISASNLLLILMPGSSAAWVKKDGTLDADALQQFFTDAKRIQDAQQATEAFEYVIEETEYFNQAPFMSSSEFMTTECGFAGGGMYLANVRRGMDLTALLSSISTLSSGSYKAAPGQSEGTYIPISPVGISAKSTKTDLAKEFCTFLLKDAQEYTLEDAWPVNQAAFDKSLVKPEDFSEETRVISSDVSSDTFELTYLWPSREQGEAFKKLAAGLSTPAVTDEYITRIVFEEGKKCLKGEIGISDTVEQITQKVNLYLAE